MPAPKVARKQTVEGAFNKKAHAQEHSGRPGPNTPPGGIIMYGGSTIPTGWLLCDGSAVSRTAYALLFAAIGTSFGAGDGSTTFNLPDLRDRFPLGVSTKSLGQTGGGGSHSSNGGHTHDGHGASIGAHGTANNTTTGGAADRATDGTHAGTHSSDGSHTHNAHTIANDLVPPYQAVNFLIKI